MATLRSLRSFFDSTPAELLDTALPSLVLLARSQHDQTLSELALLRRGAPDELAEQNRRLTLAAETAEAKCRALLAEVKNLRGSKGRPVGEEAAEIEHKFRSQLDEAEAGRAAACEELRRVKEEEMDRLMSRLRAAETANAALMKTNSVLRTVVKTNEQCNVDLQKKNLDLVAEINALEGQCQSTYKANIRLETKVATLEEDAAALEARLRGGAAGEDGGGGGGGGGGGEEARIAELAASNTQLTATVAQLAAGRAALETHSQQLEAKNTQLSAHNQHLTDSNLALTDAKKALEAAAAQLHEAKTAAEQHRHADKARLETDLRKAAKLSSTVAAGLESANKKLSEENAWHGHRHERQSQRVRDLEHECSALQERSSRMIAEIRTLREDKSRLDKHLDDLIRQQRNKRRQSVDNHNHRDAAASSSSNAHKDAAAAAAAVVAAATMQNGYAGVPTAPKGNSDTATSPVLSSRGTKRPAADDHHDSPPRNFTIRAIADNPPSTPILAPNTTSPTTPRTLFPRTAPTGPAPSPRSLFDRINHPPTSPPPLEHEITALISPTTTSKRGVFCRFHNFSPEPAELLSLVSGGPLESVRMAHDKDVAFLWFLRPCDAATFMSHARLHINLSSGPLEFLWNEKPVRALERDVAAAVVRYGAGRVFVVRCVPYDVSLQRFKAEVGRGSKKVGFWLVEGEGGKVGADGRKGREVVVEFLNVKDAVEARRRLGGEGWGEACWVREGCDRPVPNAG